MILILMFLLPLQPFGLSKLCWVVAVAAWAPTQQLSTSTIRFNSCPPDHRDLADRVLVGDLVIPGPVLR